MDSYGDGVLVLLTCYSRPQNMPAVIRAWREQSVSAKIVVVDNMPSKPKSVGASEYGNEIIVEEYPSHVFNVPTHEDAIIKAGDYFQKSDPNTTVDDVWRWTENSGCPCWLAPAAMLYGHKYVLRADDDFLPGKRAIEWLIRSATILDDEFATIGQIGRRIGYDRGDGSVRIPTYQRGNVLRKDDAEVKVDLTCRVSFMCARMPLLALSFRNRMLADDKEETARLVGIHDDFLISCGAQLASGWPSYVIPKSNDPETELIKTEIPNGPESVYKRPGHYEDRQRMLDLCVAAGWRSLA